MLSIHVADKNTIALKKTERKNIAKYLGMLYFEFGRHIGQPTPS
jgi:hypothetical protein